MNQVYFCPGCGAGLPISESTTQPSVKCSYCGNPNPNPNFVKTPILQDNAPQAEQNNNIQDNVTKEQTIKLLQSPFASLYSGVTIFATIILSLVYLLYPQRFLIYLFTAIFAMSPIVADYFVNAKWEKVVKNASAKTGEIYSVTYESNYEWHLILGYIYMVIFGTYASIQVVSYKYEVGSDGKIGLFFISFFLAYGLTWITDKIINIISTTLGHIFSKKT